MPTTMMMNPFRCRMWDLHDRLEAYISEASCRGEIASFSTHGQIVAVLARPLHGDPDYDVELITGARRLFVARHLNQPLAVDMRALSDKDALIAMDTENRLPSCMSIGDCVCWHGSRTAAPGRRYWMPPDPSSPKPSGFPPRTCTEACLPRPPREESSDRMPLNRRRILDRNPWSIECRGRTEGATRY
jgi:hypothetical protein